MSALEDDRPEFRVVRLADGTVVDLSMEEFLELTRKKDKFAEEQSED